MKIYLMSIFVLYIAYLDWKDYYIPNFWMIVSLGLCIGQSLDYLACFLFLLPIGFIKIVRPEWMGSADLFYIGLFACILGVERMIVCMLVAIGLSFCFLWVSKRRLIPFVSFLAIGFMVAWLKGYTIYGILMAWK